MKKWKVKDPLSYAPKAKTALAWTGVAFVALLVYSIAFGGA